MLRLSQLLIFVCLALYVGCSLPDCPGIQISDNYNPGLYNRFSGRTGTPIGDINGDGFEDLAINTCGSNKYIIYIILGTASPTNIEFQSLLNGTVKHFSITNAANDFKCMGIVPVGDVNGDGHPDVFIMHDGDGYVILGGPSFSNVDMKDFKSSQGFLLTNIFKDGLYMLTSPDAAGDINNDGYADIFITKTNVPVETPKIPETRIIYIVYGGPKATNIDVKNMTPEQGFRIFSTYFDIKDDSYRYFNAHAAGDLNHDGYGDLVIKSISNKIKLLVVYGNASSSDLNLDSWDNTRGYKISTNGIDVLSSGYAGDLNGDKISDIYILSIHKDAGNSIRSIYVIFGRDKNQFEDIDLKWNMTSSQYASITGTGRYFFGTSADHVGDVNGDGYDDLLAFDQESNYKYGSVSFYVIYGGPSFSSFDVKNMTASQGFTINSNGVRLEHEATSARDFNHDGFQDIIIHGMSDSFIVWGGKNSSECDVHYKNEWYLRQ